jgi:putative DNA primase/helicase
VTAPTSGRPPNPPGTYECDTPKKPALNVNRFLDSFYRDDVSERWTLLYYRDEFFVWDDTHYEPLAEGTLRAQVYDTFERGVYWGLVGGRVNGTWEWIDYDIDPAKMNALLQGLKDKVQLDPGVDMPVWLHESDNRPVAAGKEPVDPHAVIPCLNGLLNTATRTLWAHTPRYLNGYAVAYEYEPRATAPQEWLNFLKSLWPDDSDSISTLQEMFGYLLTQRNDQQKMFMLYGAKRGGKGTIIRVLEALMGENNVTGTSIADLNHGDFGLSSLEGKQLAVMSDVRFRSRDDGTAVERLLKITGNDSVLINKKYKQPYTARLTTRFLMASNELPKMTDESGALQNRIILLKFEQSFLGREDLDLERRLREELPGILNWALDGLDRLNERGKFLQPGSGNSALEIITNLSSPSLAFIGECCVISPAGLVGQKELFNMWQSWCAENNVPIGSSIGFGRAIHAAAPMIRVVKRGPKGAQRAMYEGIDVTDAGRALMSQTAALENWLRPNPEGQL